MTAAIAYFSSTIGRKQLTAVAGLGLCGFVLAHVIGNFLLFVSPAAYNLYSHKLISNPLIYVAEVGLVAIFVIHSIVGVLVSLKNRSARKKGYSVPASGEKRTSWTSKTLMWQGIVLFIFVVLHLITFKFGTVYTTSHDGVEVRDLYRLVVEVFQSPVYVAWYVVSVSILAFHLAHGLGSSFQTLGMNHPKYNPAIRKISVIYGLLIGLGFASQPLYMFFIYKG